MTQIVESHAIELVNKFIQQQGKLFRCFKADGTTSKNCGEPLEWGCVECGGISKKRVVLLGLKSRQ